MSSSAPRDAGDLDHRVVLTMTPVPALVGLVLVGEAADLRALGLAHHARRDGGPGQVGRLGDDRLTVDEQHRCEGHLTVGGAELLDLDAVALGHPLLLPTSADHCVHSPAMLPDPPRRAELCTEPVAMAAAFVHSSP